MSLTARLRCNQDAFVNDNFPARNYGDQPKLSLNDASPEKRAFLNFGLKSLPSAANIRSAVLSVVLRGDAPGSNDLEIQRIDERWSEDHIHWSNQPGVAGVIATVSVIDGLAGDVIEVDVTTMVAAAVERGKTWHGLRIVATAGGLNLHASEVADHSLRPRLEVAYSGDPDAPVKLRPRGGDAVDAPQPQLAWEADAQSALRVQVNSTDDFSAPDYDSGWVTSEETGWNLADATAPTFDAMADGDTVYWHVQIKDPDDNASEFSSTRHFERRTYGTFDIASPATDGDAVEESSPTIITALTGRSQRRLGWRLRVRDLDEPDEPFLTVISDAFETGRATADPSFEMPRRSVTDRALTYQIQARVWDEYDRGTAVAERAYKEASREFIYDPAAGVTAPSALAATQDGIHPKVSLTWSRASAPDSFDIYVDGKAVVQQLDPADAFVSGTSYAYELWGIVPNREHTFEVIATENHRDSIANPTDTYTPSVKGVWLLCQEKALSVRLESHEQPKQHLGETSAVFELLNRASPVMITDTIRGIEGSVGGVMRSSDAGTIAQQWRALLRLKALRGDSEVRLVLPALNIPVLLGEFDLPIVPPADREQYDVTVPFWQEGEFEVPRRRD